MVYICSICTDSLDSPDQYPVTLPCRHIFHNDCVGAWIEQQKKCPFCKMHTKTEDIKTLYFSSEEDGPRNDSDWKNAAAKYRVYFKKAAEDLKISRAANIYLERRIDAYKKIARDLVKEEEFQWRLSDNKKRLELELETAQKKIIQQEELIKQLDRDLINSAKNFSYQVETAKEKENELKRKDSEMWDKYLFKEAELSSCKSDLARQTENLRKQLSFFTDHHVQCTNSAIVSGNNYASLNHQYMCATQAYSQIAQEKTALINEKFALLDLIRQMKENNQKEGNAKDQARLDWHGHQNNDI